MSHHTSAPSFYNRRGGHACTRSNCSRCCLSLTNWLANRKHGLQQLITFLEKKKDKVAPKSLKQAPKPLTANGKAVAAVLKPNAGKSYNPLLNDWSALLEKEGQAAVDAEKARLAAEAAQAERERKAEEEAAKVEALEKEEYATDYESAWESEWDGIASEAEQESYTQKQKGRKTPATSGRRTGRRGGAGVAGQKSSVEGRWRRLYSRGGNFAFQL